MVLEDKLQNELVPFLQTMFKTVTVTDTVVSCIDGRSNSSENDRAYKGRAQISLILINNGNFVRFKFDPETNIDFSMTEKIGYVLNYFPDLKWSKSVDINSGIQPMLIEKVAPTKIVRRVLIPKVTDTYLNYGVSTISPICIGLNPTSTPFNSLSQVVGLVTAYFVPYCYDKVK
jgi:hypothetical protein